ncbi:hypothetical protein QJS04_geneDACA021895 [Acorus gramineus]|uniref:Uncharacterized protein n=1 Tax=Acorus gramineus TaxID=55184 RepID=A0AAV9B986_ACOGR|nr:hypothetical protein QJS04_geneDACA021895 [Acorus gramineus]
MWIKACPATTTVSAVESASATTIVSTADRVRQDKLLCPPRHYPLHIATTEGQRRATNVDETEISSARLDIIPSASRARTASASAHVTWLTCPSDARGGPRVPC